MNKLRQLMEGCKFNFHLCSAQEFLIIGTVTVLDVILLSDPKPEASIYWHYESL